VAQPARNCRFLCGYGL